MLLLLGKIKVHGIKTTLRLLINHYIKNLYYQPFFETYSQYGEDIIIDKLLGYKLDGVYVDIGAYDPHILSNTKKFYNRGWRGINVDLGVERIEKFNEIRKYDKNIVSGVSDLPGSLEAVRFEETSSFTFSESFIQRNLHKGFKIREKREVKVRTLETILDKHLGPEGIDFLSVDTEGFDLKVLKGNNWKKYRPKVICVEALHPTDKKYNKLQQNFLENKGYRKVRSNGLNTFYTDLEWDPKREARSLNKKVAEVVDEFRADIFSKLDFEFEREKKILDVGCGNGKSSKVFRDVYNLEVKSCDVYKHENIDDYELDFTLEGLPNLSFGDDSFDYVFLHDILHHIDEENQSFQEHSLALKELQRVVKDGGKIIILEGNRYNPLFYPHMVKLLGHNHFTQNYFYKLLSTHFTFVSFRFFESHSYPWWFKPIASLFEFIMSTPILVKFRAYNVGVVTVREKSGLESKYSNSPEFLGIGVVKSGTTWLAHQIRKHPELFLPYQKEIYFFDALEVDSNYYKGTNWYMSFFEDAGKEQKAGEFTTHYMYSSQSSKLIKQNLPNTKLIVCLRNPCDMAHSFYWWFKATYRGVDLPDTFEESIEERNEILDRGYYFMQLEPYYSLFDKDSIKVVLLEDIKEDARKVTESIYKFLEVDDTFIPEGLGDRINTAKEPRSKFFATTVNKSIEILGNIFGKRFVRDIKSYKFLYDFYTLINKKDFNYPDMNEETREKLVDMYKEDIDKLEGLINRDLSAWKKI